MTTSFTLMRFQAITSIPADINTMPGFVIDLGFATRRASVGLAHHLVPQIGSTHRFSDVIRTLNESFATLASEGKPNAFLFIEAPLSFAFTEGGDPCHRNIELQKNYEPGSSPLSPKGWFYQAGANLSLASILFLRRLEIPDGLTIHLAEAFFCSTTRAEAHTDDDVVASSLLASILSAPGAPLEIPVSDHRSLPVQILPGLEDIVQGIPGVLLRTSLQLKTRP